MLTEEMLDHAATDRRSSGDKIFASGQILLEIEVDYNGKSVVECTWSAVVGVIGDWSIYHSGYFQLGIMRAVNINQTSGESLDPEVAQTAAYGRKIYDDNLIQKLVPCTEGAFKRYRF